MRVDPDTVTVSTTHAADGGVTVEAVFAMKPLGAEIVEAVVNLVGVSEAGFWVGGGGECFFCVGRVAFSHNESTRNIALQEGGGHFLADPVPVADAPAEPDREAARDTGSIAVKATYAVHPDGSVGMRWEFDTSDALPTPLPWGFKSLPRVGVHVALPDTLELAEWYGGGPHECYADRKDAALARRHSMAAADLHVPYIFPGECGGRADVRWLALSGGAGPGVAAIALKDAIQANVSK